MPVDFSHDGNSSNPGGKLGLSQGDCMAYRDYSRLKVGPVPLSVEIDSLMLGASKHVRARPQKETKGRRQKEDRDSGSARIFPFCVILG